MFQLKKGKEAFTVVEGLFKGRSFKPGQPYAEIPLQEAGKFETIKKAAAPVRDGAKPGKADSKKAIVNSPSEKGGGKS
jgi:hypothetical protein